MVKKMKNNLKIQITIYKQMKIMYNINIIKVLNKLIFLEVNQYEV